MSEEDLLAQPPGANWTSYNGDYTGRRDSSLREINAANVAQLRSSWVFHPGNSQRIEATPVVVHGIMYVTAANSTFALDARTGRALWHHERPVSSGLLDDAHLLCLDARSGSLRWDVAYADKARHYGATSAPLVVEGAVIVGTSGGDSNVRGFLELIGRTHLGCSPADVVVKSSPTFGKSKDAAAFPSNFSPTSIAHPSKGNDSLYATRAAMTVSTYESEQQEYYLWGV